LSIENEKAEQVKKARKGIVPLNQKSGPMKNKKRYSRKKKEKEDG
jgi:hypothetical protein